MNELKKISANTTVGWSFDHELADGSWQFSYAFRGPGVINIEASSASGVVVVDVSAAITAAWVPGLYEWHLFASKADDRQLIESGSAEVLADFASLEAGYDSRSLNKKMLDAINTVLQGRILSDHERYSIDGRSLDRIPIMELQSLKRQYSIKVRRERHSGGDIRVRKVKARFLNG